MPTQQDIDNLNRAIASGELTVSAHGRSVTYRSVPELIKARDDAEAQMRAQQRTSTRRSFHFNFKTLRGD